MKDARAPGGRLRGDAPAGTGLFILAAVAAWSGCHAPLVVNRPWLAWYNQTTLRADSLTSAFARGRSEAAVALVPLLRAAEDSIPWHGPDREVGHSRRLLVALIARTRCNLLAAADSEEVARLRQMQSLGLRTDRHWSAGEATAGREAWRELHRLAGATLPPLDLPEELAAVDQVRRLIDRVAGLPLDPGDTLLTPRVTAGELARLRADLDSLEQRRPRRLEERNARLADWDRRLRSAARRHEVERHNLLNRELAAAGEADRGGEHRQAAAQFERIALCADSMRRESDADESLVRAPGRPADSTDAAAMRRAWLALAELARENRRAARFNHALRRFDQVERAWDHRDAGRASTLAALDSLLGMSEVDAALRVRLQEFREEVAAAP